MEGYDRVNFLENWRDTLQLPLNFNDSRVDNTKLSSFEDNLYILVLQGLELSYNNAEIAFDIKELQTVLEKKHVAISKFVQQLEEGFAELGKVKFQVENNQTVSLLDKTEIDGDSQSVFIKINTLIAQWINSSKQNYYIIYLSEYLNISSMYLKDLYIDLRRHEHQHDGWAVYPLGKLRKLLHLQDYFSIAKIHTRIVQHAMHELSPYFNQLHTGKSYNADRTVKSIIFKWTPEPKTKYSALINIQKNGYMTIPQKDRAFELLLGLRKGKLKELRFAQKDSSQIDLENLRQFYDNKISNFINNKVDFTTEKHDLDFESFKPLAEKLILSNSERINELKKMNELLENILKTK